jgi:hypothetical protein
MNKDTLTRRHFLQKTGIATGAVLSLSALHPKPARAAGPFVRKDVGSLSATDPILTSYATAITAMQKLDMSDPTNPLGWQYQAAIHGTTSPSTTPGEVATWNTCEHGTQYFLSWHRMYLYYFERIIRKMSANASWALPYWNYESSSEASLPAAFYTPATAANSLYTVNRGPHWNTGKAALLPSAVSTTTAFGDINFGSFWSDLESTPHDAVHMAIGGLMGVIQTSAQDPIFYLHHCNIDRLWNLWLAQGGGRSDPLSTSASDQLWQNSPFTFFDENKNQVTLTGCDILRAQDQLGYQYDTEPPQVRQFCRAEFHIPIVYYIPWFLCWPGPVIIPPLIGPTEFSASTEELARHMDTTPLSSLKTGSNIVLKLTEVQADHQPNVFYEVYVGLATGAAAHIESPAYVGNLAMFGRGLRDMKQHGSRSEQSESSERAAQFASFTFKITGAVEAVLKHTKAPKTLRILLVPRGALIDGRPEERKPTATIHIGRAEIGLERVE